MKRVLFLSVAASLCLSACGDKADVQLKARTMKEAQQRAAAQKPTAGLEEAPQNIPDNANFRILVVDGYSTRNVTVGKDTLQTTVLCSENLAQSMAGEDRIKIQGGSQILLRQEVRLPNPDGGQFKVKQSDAPKALVSLSCHAKSADLTKEPADKNVTSTKLETGKTVSVVGRFGTIQTDEEFTATIGCVASDKFSEGPATGVDILMTDGSKMTFETSTKDKDVKKYILVSCDKAAAVAAETPAN